MKNENSETQFRVLDRGETLTAGSGLLEEIVGDRTIVNVEEISREYKLKDAYRDVRNLEYRSEEEIDLQLFGDYLKDREIVVPLSFKAERRPRPRFPSDEAYRNRKIWHLYQRGDVLVLVTKRVYAQVSASIDQYVRDLARDGYWATVHVIEGGRPADVRQYIRRRRPVGAVLVGSIPVPWFELDNDFHGVHSEFPCDLYYMDINGTWTDPDGDGKFSGHTNNLDPEIWIGRIFTPTAGGDDAALINDYFARNHAFRLGRLGQARSALAFVDDDWQGFGDCELDAQFPSSLITVYTDPNKTDADLYKAEVNSLRSWVQLCAHSSPRSHALWVPSKNKNEYIRESYFRDTNPPNAHFYNLFCCGPGRFTTSDYLAGWYIFDKSGGGTDHGLTAIASAKSGSMKYFADFYRPLGQGKTIGDAFVEWWRARGPSHEHAERCWYYGLVLLGDPTLSWWKGAVPSHVQPQKNDVFDHWPRKMTLKWDPVDISGAKYSVEIDAFGAVNGGKWAEETNQTFFVRNNITETTLDYNFVGMQRGRWRVRARIGSKFCSWSPWSYFRFTV